MQLFFELEILCHEFSTNFKSLKVINNWYPVALLVTFTNSIFIQIIIITY